MSKNAFTVTFAVLVTLITVLLAVVAGRLSPNPDFVKNFAAYVAFGIAMSIYFLPGIIAGFRNHHNTAAILVLNFFLGWTGIGWIAAIVWSATNVAPVSR